MRRRRVLVTGIVAATIGIAGCLGGDAGATPTDTPSSTPTESGAGTPTRTQAEGLGTIEYTVTNEDDEAHRFEARTENAEGRVVQETFEPSLPPGGSVGSGDAGLPPDAGPYTLTFSTDAATATHVWDVRECARADLRVTIRDGGRLTVERVLCQN